MIFLWITHGSIIVPSDIQCLRLNKFSILNKINTQNATRITDKSATLIDHIVTSDDPANLSTVTTEENDLSDHKILKFNIKKKVKTFVPKREMEVKRIDVIKFKKELESLSSSQVISSFTELVKLIKIAKDNSTKIQKIRCKLHNDWMNSETLNLIKSKDKLYKKTDNLGNVKYLFPQALYDLLMCFQCLSFNFMQIT